ncbi:hypothetical protein QBC47DRAFT_377737 [Echria macrotheca]|uniref:Nephrocystin 3-like N-terminal domain-containing protein n=1 Tax=Echria macrotheca TaxID=438768 RepID=A0AAJ0FAZ2_9PEZI|nr:hypothetical protein QBC47DRAFT_377737 [Echria macrotheca]
MDPLSLSASVIAILQLAGSCLSLSRKWLGPSEFGSTSLAAIKTTLLGFTGAMNAFQTHLKAHGHDEARLKSLEYLSPALARCQESLDVIRDFLDNSSFIGRHVIGPRFDRKLKPALRAVEAAKELFGFALHADHQTILLKVERGITVGLKRLHENGEETQREVKRVREDISRITTSLSSSPTTREQISSDTHQKKLLLDSLRFDQIDARHATIKNAHAKTCRWLLKQSEYLDWLDPSKLDEHRGFLWIRGKPGAGKSTLMKFALTNARKAMKDTIVISFFFNARGEDLEKSTMGMYRSLLLQLFERLPALQSVLDTLDLPTWNGGSHIWSVEPLKDLFEQALRILGGSSLTCFIDALDECEEGQIRDMISFFEHMGDLTTSSGIRFRVCFASRHYPHITIAKGLGLILEGQEGHSQDILSYVNSELKIGHSKLAEQIRTDLQEKAAGVFMWVVLVVGILNEEHDRGRIHALRQRLRAIPEDLHELFRDILTRDQQNKGELLLCIQWVLYARRPLKPEQLYFAVLSGVEPGALSEWDPDEITGTVIRRFILNSSKGLAEVTKSQQPTVQFIHESVKDFLLKGNGLNQVWADLESNFQGESHERLKQCCLNYMEFGLAASLNITESLPPAPSEEAAELRKSSSEKYPFLEYAVQGVLFHADAAQGSGVGQKDFLQQFQLANWIHLNNLFERREVRRYTNASLLYILAERNMAALTRVHPSAHDCFTAGDERYGPPIFAALATGSDEAVRSFVEVLLQRQPRQSRLHGPCRQFLKNLENGNRGSTFGRTFQFSQKKAVATYVFEQMDESFWALFAAAGYANAKDKDGRTLLWHAAEKRDESLVTWLLENGADTEANLGMHGRTPLLWAAEKGCEGIVRLLLLKGAKIEAKGGLDSSTPLSRAAREGHEGIVKLLLESGANINAKDARDHTPLLWAIDNRHEGVMRLLIENGADIEVREEIYGGMPLLLAAKYGYESAVKLFLERGADVEAKDYWNRTALSWVAGYGHDRTVRLLLDKGADIEAKDEDGWTPLLWAARRGHEGVVRLLLEKGADTEVKDEDGWTPLICAARNGHEGVVRLLLEKGADIEAKNRDGWTPLVWAARNGHEGVVRLLLDKGADTEVEATNGQMPLLLAVEAGQERIVEVLLGKGVDIEVKDLYGRTPLTLGGRERARRCREAAARERRRYRSDRRGWPDGSTVGDFERVREYCEVPAG